MKHPTHINSQLIKLMVKIYSSFKKLTGGGPAAIGHHLTHRSDASVTTLSQGQSLSTENQEL